MSASNQSLSQGATEQAASLQEIASSIVQIGSQTKTNAEVASQAAEVRRYLSQFKLKREVQASPAPAPDIPDTGVSGAHPERTTGNQVVTPEQAVTLNDAEFGKY